MRKILALLSTVVAVSAFAAPIVSAQAQEKNQPPRKQEKPAEDKFPDLPFFLNTGAVTFRVTNEMGVMLDDRPNGCERTIWMVANPSAKPRPKALTLITRIKFTDKAWPDVQHDPAGLQREIVAAVDQTRKELASAMALTSPDQKKYLIEEIYGKVQDPRRIFGENGIGYAIETISNKNPEDSIVTGNVTPGGAVTLSRSSGSLSGAAYIVDIPRKTTYTVQYITAELSTLEVLGGCIRIVMSAELTKPALAKPEAKK